jgi:general secretion pathway protein G
MISHVVREKIARERAARRTSERGLTLVEMLVVILLIGLIGGGVGVTVIRQFYKARVGIAESKVRELAKAVDLYVLENNRLPDSLAELKSKENGGPFFEDTLVDPWGSEYILKELGGREFDVVSLGDDSEPGGEGLAKDISYRDLTGGDEEKNPF